MPIQRSKETVAGYYLKGVDDWFCYMQDSEGDWFMISTELAQEWNLIPGELMDSQGGVFLVAIAMLQNGRKPEKIDLAFTRELTETYGDS